MLSASLRTVQRPHFSSPGAPHTTPRDAARRAHEAAWAAMALLVQVVAESRRSGCASRTTRSKLLAHRVAIEQLLLNATPFTGSSLRASSHSSRWSSMWPGKCARRGRGRDTGGLPGCWLVVTQVQSHCVRISSQRSFTHHAAVGQHETFTRGEVASCVLAGHAPSTTHTLGEAKKCQVVPIASPAILPTSIPFVFLYDARRIDHLWRAPSLSLGASLRCGAAWRYRR